MKHLGLSGGGTKIAGLFGAAEAMMMDKGYQPDIISGVSAGAVLAVPLALGKFDVVRDLVLNLELSTFFSTIPVKKNGKIKIFNATKKLITGKHYLGEQKNLERELRKVVSKSEFEEFKRNPNIPRCVIAMVDFYSGSRLYVDLKTVSYELFPRLVNGSSSIPVFTPGVEVKEPLTDVNGNTTSGKMLLFDGGVRDHNPTGYMLTKLNNQTVSESASVFSRPENNDVLAKPWHPKNLLKILSRTFDITNTEVSKGDQYTEEEYWKDNIFNHGTFYLPKIMNDVYDVNKERLGQMYQAGRKLVLDDDGWKNQDLIA